MTVYCLTIQLTDSPIFINLLISVDQMVDQFDQSFEIIANLIIHSVKHSTNLNRIVLFIIFIFIHFITLCATFTSNASMIFCISIYIIVQSQISNQLLGIQKV
jgi:di/tricarboxylate transporter